MLLYSTSIQPPRKYPYGPPNPITSPSIPASPQFPHVLGSVNFSTLCSRCYSIVWKPQLFYELRDHTHEQQSFCTNYKIQAKELREGVMEECEWCRKLADGINGSVFLDAVYKEWASTDSWPESGSEGEDADGEKEPESPEEEDKRKTREEDEDEDEESSEVKGEEVGKEGSWENASAFHKEELETDSTSEWHSYSDGDILAFDAILAISLSFERGENAQFTFLNVRIALLDGQEGDNVLRKALSSKSVELRWRINMAEAEKSQMNRGFTELFPLQPIDTNLGSTSNMRYIREWSHKTIPMVNAAAENPIRTPSRLIDIGAENLRVVETSTFRGSQPEDKLHGYAALSYVWGQNQTFILLNSTQDLLMSSFSIAQLPQTIQDAVSVTREIGLRYLWVDALCIMQDSDEDKAIELPKMRLIYQSAAITLVASIAKSATEGFLHHVANTAYMIPPIHIPIPSASSLEWQKEQGPNMVLSYPSPYMRHKDPINTRAWTFQELLLSPRCILFTYRGLETVDRGNIPSAGGFTSGRDPQMPDLFPWSGPMFSLTNVKEEDIRPIWLSVRGEYSRRKLTYEGDKLVAIAAVAEEVGKVYKGRYLAGLWENDLLRELKWCRGDSSYTEGDGPGTSERLSRSEDYVAPSWSWASVREPVNDYAFDEHDDVEEVINTLGFGVVSCEVEPVIPGFAYGAVRSGVLVVSGRMHSFFWRPEEHPTPMQSDGFLAVRAKNESFKEWKVGQAIIDALDPELVDGCIVDCIAMGLEERIPGKKEVEGLMLLPVGDEQYRRVGFCRIEVIDLFDDVEPVEITIV